LFRIAASRGGFGWGSNFLPARSSNFFERNMRFFPKRIPSGIPALLAAVFLLTGCFVSERPSAPRAEGEDTFALDIKVGIGGVNALRKSSTITLDKLIIVLTSSSNDTIRDTITSSTTPNLDPVSTTGQNIPKSYTLKALRSWKIVATST